MDTFFEQIVAIRKNASSMMKIVGILLLAAVLSFVLYLFVTPFVGFAVFLLIFGVYYGAYQLIIRQSVEYEYIVTNGSMDIDKIIAQRSRKRELSFDISTVERIEKYNPAVPPVGNFKKTVMACTPDNENTYYMVISSEAKGTRLLVFAPDERLKGAIVKSLPKFIANSAFKD